MVMRIADALVDELTLEAATTKRVLERVPEARLGWQPHPKSMSLGQLALHVATLPNLVTQFLSGDALDFESVPKEPPTVATHAHLLAAFASSTEQARSYLANLSDERATSVWRLVAGERHLLAAPRAAMLRSLLFNHWYHHRGQLLVYLRLLDVPVPSVYGPTADENPFATA
jgi:uncharacterized damage-inducible protein DinB